MTCIRTAVVPFLFDLLNYSTDSSQTQIMLVTAVYADVTGKILANARLHAGLERQGL